MKCSRSHVFTISVRDYSSVFVRISFIITSLITGPLLVCAAVISALVHHYISIFSFLTSSEVAIASDSIVINFVSLTLYTQATVLFLVPLGKFILSRVLSTGRWGGELSPKSFS